MSYSYFSPVDCPFCNSDDAYVTTRYFQGEQVAYCPYCSSSFTLITGYSVVWKSEGGDDEPDPIED